MPCVRPMNGKKDGIMKKSLIFSLMSVLAGLKLQLTCTATITSISVKGNNNETLCAVGLSGLMRIFV